MSKVGQQSHLGLKKCTVSRFKRQFDKMGACFTRPWGGGSGGNFQPKFTQFGLFCRFSTEGIGKRRTHPKFSKSACFKHAESGFRKFLGGGCGGPKWAVIAPVSGDGCPTQGKRTLVVLVSSIHLVKWPSFLQFYSLALEVVKMDSSAYAGLTTTYQRSIYIGMAAPCCCCLADSIVEKYRDTAQRAIASKILPDDYRMSSMQPPYYPDLLQTDILSRINWFPT